ncbi:PAS domain S-box-containing protein [Chitinophaga dinghuensis]|uniref:Sensory/regulatory protein RpfC n=1 Tax=Chitinophaga dinghuensis TaxID=1539050 RepID=A0A327W5Z3_9BACT|nr:PAS domain-containing hybrid sensor histidine kinase/response regulator [Chitinophaga dinghuensis]RAJ85331.1 PAS domain S-box-containing protein [Chitinophaga dinghuensis]
MKKIVNSVIWLFVTIGLVLCVLLFYAWNIRQRTQAAAALLLNKSISREQLHVYIQKDLSYTSYSFLFIMFVVFLAIVFLCVEARQISWHISRLRERANRMHKNAQSYKRLAQQAGPIMYTSSPEGYFTFVNDAVEDITGYSAEEVVGKHYSMFLDKKTFEQLQPFYVQQMKGYQDYSSTQFEIITRSGERKFVEQLVSAIRDDDGRVTEFQCVVRDLYSSKEADYSGDYIRERMEAVIDFTPSMMFIKDMTGRYILTNRRFLDVMGIRKDDIIGQIDDDLPYPWVSRYARLDAQVISTGHPATMDDTLEINGEQTHYYITKFPLRNAYDEMIGICCTAHDVTERKNYIKELVKTQRLAEEAKRAQETFLANMSHEIRTPMNGILGMTRLLMQDTRLQENQMEFVHAIQTSASNLLVIINEILDFSKIKAGKLKLEEKPFILREEIEKALYPLKHQAQEKKLDFITVIDENIPKCLIGDKIRLLQVLVNLVENAIKFTARGSVSVYVSALDADEKSVSLVYEVTDTGIGIAQEKQQFVFDSFTQTHADNNRTFGGTGLGLAICKELVEMQNGAITLDSTPGKGSRFRVVQPFLYDNSLSPEVEQLSPHILKGKPLLGKSILVVEDNLINQKVAWHALNKGGARVHMVENGRVAVELLLFQKYDCILMDIQMPGMDGYEATRLIRKNGITTAIIAMTASALKGEKERCLEIGMNDYISKPYEQEELYTKILKATGSWVPAPMPSVAPVQEVIPAGPDSDYLRDKVGLDDQEILGLYQDMLTEFPNKLEELQQNVQQQNWEQVFMLAHQLKTLFTLLQFKEAMSLSLSIERDAQTRENLATIPHRVGNLMQAWHTFLPALKMAANQAVGNVK